MSGLDGEIRLTTLDSGLRIVTEQVPALASVGLGIWVGVGSRDEPPELAGATHVLEHLLFKGTSTRSAREIADALDMLGGQGNAFTAREATCFHTRVLGDELAPAVELFADLLTRSTCQDLDSERTVVLEEIAARDDDASDLVHDESALAILGDTELGRPVLGTVASVNALTRDALETWWRTTYTPDRMVVSAAGAVDHDALVELAAHHLPGPPAAVRAGRAGRAGGAGGAGRAGGAGGSGGAGQAGQAGGAVNPQVRGVAQALRVVEQDAEQVHLVWGCTGLTLHDPRRHALGILDTVLGGGMGSRLFQEVREARGLAYGIWTQASLWSDDGTFGVAASCSPKRLAALLDVTATVLADVQAHGITAAELARAQRQSRTSVLLDAEDTAERMERVGSGVLSRGSVRTQVQVLASIAAVSLDDVAAVAHDLLSRPRALTAVGPVAAADLTGVQ